MFTVFPYFKYSVSNLLTVQLQDHLKYNVCKKMCRLDTQSDKVLYSHGTELVWCIAALFLLFYSFSFEHGSTGWSLELKIDIQVFFFYSSPL